MAILAFPPLEQADENGLLAFGGDLEASSLRLAYSQGIFPWPIGKRYPLAWFSPDPRGILQQSDLHLSRSLKKILKKLPWRITFNRQFSEVILNCAETPNRTPLEGQHGTWITPQIIDAYIDFFHAGHAFSVEVWLHEELVGGLYGVRVGKAVCGESMFHNHDNASKVALVALMHHLNSHDIDFLDTQMVTSVVASMGGIEIPRVEFISRLAATRDLIGDDIFNDKVEYYGSDLLG